MSLQYPFASLVCLLLTVSCSGPDTNPLSSLQGTEWSFSMDNPIDSGWVFPPLSVGDIAAFDGDSLRIQNMLNRFTSSYLLGPAATPRDSLVAIWPEETAEGKLKLKLMFGDSVLRERLFEPYTPTEELLTGPELAAGTYLIATNDGDSNRVYLGYAEKVPFMKNPGLYFVSTGKNVAGRGSVVLEGSHANFYSNTYVPRPVEWSAMMLPFRRDSEDDFLASHPFFLVRTPAGQTEAHRIETTANHYVLRKYPLVAKAPTVPLELSVAEFCDRVNEGQLTVNRDYSEPTEEQLRFAADEDFAPRGITTPELDQLSFNLNPEGEFFLFAGERLVQHGRWVFSPDRNYLIQVDREAGFFQHYPIEAFTDEYLEFRFPLKVQTAKPRGQVLLSFYQLDALLKVNWASR